MVGIRRWSRAGVLLKSESVLSDAIRRLMLGEAYSNGEAEVRETITTMRDEGEGERKWEVHRCLL